MSRTPRPWHGHLLRGRLLTVAQVLPPALAFLQEGEDARGQPAPIIRRPDAAAEHILRVTVPGFPGHPGAALDVHELALRQLWPATTSGRPATTSGASGAWGLDTGQTTGRCPCDLSRGRGQCAVEAFNERRPQFMKAFMETSSVIKQAAFTGSAHGDAGVADAATCDQL